MDNIMDPPTCSQGLPKMSGSKNFITNKVMWVFIKEKGRVLTGRMPIGESCIAVPLSPGAAFGLK